MGRCAEGRALALGSRMRDPNGRAPTTRLWMLQTIEPSDEALVARVASGDVGAFAALYDRYGTRVYAWAAHLLGVGEADDVAQDVFLKLWHRATMFDPSRGRFAPWFGAVARHQILARARRLGRERRGCAAAGNVQEVASVTCSHANLGTIVREARAAHW